MIVKVVFVSLVILCVGWFSQTPAWAQSNKANPSAAASCAKIQEPTKKDECVRAAKAATSKTKEKSGTTAEKGKSKTAKAKSKTKAKSKAAKKVGKKKTTKKKVDTEE